MIPREAITFGGSVEDGDRVRVVATLTLRQTVEAVRPPTRPFLAFRRRLEDRARRYLMAYLYGDVWVALPVIRHYLMMATPTSQFAMPDHGWPADLVDVLAKLEVLGKPEKKPAKGGG